MPNLGILGLKFENNIVIFEISTLELVYLQNLAKKRKFCKSHKRIIMIELFFSKVASCNATNKRLHQFLLGASFF